LYSLLAFVHIRHSNIYTVPSFQINPCKFWQVIDDEEIALVLSYHPKMLDYMRIECGYERKERIIRRSEAMYQTRRKRVLETEDTSIA
jgi:hypothetical protein